MCSRACLLRYTPTSFFARVHLIALASFKRRLPPTCALQFCLLLVCPHLSGWVSSSDGEPVPLALSPESIYNSGQKIFVLDSFINVRHLTFVFLKKNWMLTRVSDHSILWDVSLCRSHASPCWPQACPGHQALEIVSPIGENALQLCLHTSPLT